MHYLKCFVATSCLSLGFTSATAAIPKTMTLTPFITGSAALPLNKPILINEMPNKPGYYVVLEQHVGKISIFYKVGGNWTKVVMDTVGFASGVTGQNEMGLLGIAFHPNFAVNRKYYLTYNPSTTRTYLVERQADSTFLKRNTSVAQRLLIAIGKPYTNHNGGTIAFGPNDGFLYFGTGDGGSGGDPGNRAQNPDSLQGKFLRIDVDHPAGGKEYGIPADNPFINAGHAQEVFALGLRNPWRWSFDKVTGNIWLGHVGQGLWESASLVPKGANLGWRVIEGNQCYSPATGCSMTGYQLPFLTYSHDAAANGDSTGNCIIGGYIYRGNPASAFYGLYFYGDNRDNRIWVARTDGVTKQESILEGVIPGATGQSEGFTSFGTDLAGNLYAIRRGTNSLTAADGIIYILGGPDLPLVTTSVRHTGKVFAPALGTGLNVDLHTLQGRKVSGSATRNGLYVAKYPGAAATLMPVLK